MWAEPEPEGHDMGDARGRITMVRERVGQAEEGVAQLHTVLEQTEHALAVAEQVEQAARRSRKLLKVLLVLTVLGVAVAIVVKLTRSGDPDPAPERDRSAAAEANGA